MASLRDMVSEYQDDLRNGIAWLAFWREGRSWQAEAFHLDLDDTLYPEDRARLAEIQAADPRAVVVNGYYSGYLGEEMNVAELAAGVRHHYDNGLNNIAPFMEAHSDELPPDVLEEAREKAHAAGLPFYERPYRGDDIDPYTYDGHMSIEDYELMQKLMEQDRERREPVSEVFSIMIDNRAEAQNEPLSCMIGVGNVVLNRVASDEYPDNVFDVIFDEKYGQQFEPVGNGTVYADPTEEAIIATYLVLEGYNTVGGSMYFLNPHLADDTWFRTDLQFCCTLGLMDFYQ